MEPVLQLVIPYCVQKVAFLLSAIMKYVRDLTAELLSEVCHNVEIESYLQPLNGETLQIASYPSGAWLDISMNDFWGGCYENVTQTLSEYLTH